MNIVQRVLSIQSHVVHGYVGNRCSQFTIQAHEFEIDAINSVQFSNHTAYKSWKGEILSDKQLAVLYDGLKENNLNFYSHLLTGYSRSESFLSLIASIVKDLRHNNPKLFYLCDPVMGDNGSYYVPETLLPIYRDILVPMADVIVPNQFEIQELSGVIIKNEIDLLFALETLHERGSKRIVVTSTDLCSDNNFLHVYSSDFSNGTDQVLHRFEIPRYPVIFLGTGDLFASLLLVWLEKKRDLKAAVQTVLGSMHGVLENTYRYAKAHAVDPNNLTMADLELRLIQSRKHLLEPTFEVKCTPLIKNVTKESQ